MNNHYTSADKRSLEEMLDRYEQMKREYEEQCYNEISTQEDYDRLPFPARELINDYRQCFTFLTEARNALDFTQSSTSVTLTDDPRSFNYQVNSLYANQSDYVEAVTVLTGGFSDRMKSALEATRTNPVYTQYMSNEMYAAVINAPLATEEISKEIGTLTQGHNILAEKTVGEVVNTIDFTKRLREKYYIRDEELIDDTVYTLNDEVELGYANVLSKQENNREYEPISVVVSNDGYIMNTSEEVTYENVDEYNKHAENGNEVRDNGVPKETTSDMSKVGGKVKYEEADDIGSIEKEDGELTYEEKTDKEDNEKHEDKKKQDVHER